jgi:hypothetical protein
MDTLFASLNWGTLADWVSGIGSLSAAGVALYVSFEAKRIDLKGTCGIRNIVGGNVTDHPRLINISAVNLGTRSTTVTMISMRIGKRRSYKYAVIPMHQSLYSAGLPLTLNDGQRVDWSLEIDSTDSVIRDLSSEFIESHQQLKTLVFQIHTSHGKVINIKPEDALIKLFANVIQDSVI